jgi:hypothetical protein
MADAEASKKDIFIWRYRQVGERVRKVLRELYRWVNRPDISILGAYHGENVGDIALGDAVCQIVNQSGRTGSLQDVYRLQRQRVGDTIILGGGATGVESNVMQLADAYGEMAPRTAMVGMDFSGDFADYPDEALSYLRDVRYISCRSKEQTEMVGRALQRDDVRFHYDNAFALSGTGTPSRIRGERVLGYNALNFFMVWTGDRFEPGTHLEEWYRKVNSPILPYLDRIGPAYVRVLRKALRAYKDEGHKVVHLPFTPEDALFAKTYFRSQTDTFLPYSSNVNDVIGRVASCDRLLSTRYHSLVFGIKCRVPTIPLLYAVKCTDLLEDLGIGKEFGIERTDLVDETDACVDQLVNGRPIVLDSDRLDTIEAQVQREIREALQSVTQQ